VVVRGFVDDMPDWMGSSDLVVTKAGPSSICEALAAGLPMVLYGFIAGQEEGNVPYVTEQGVGVHIEAREELARQIADWLRPGDGTLAQMAARARALGRTGAADQVVAQVTRLMPIR
jgi:1,2-diacylglycerol 3-beta-galactosyltransferase